MDRQNWTTRFRDADRVGSVDALFDDWVGDKTSCVYYGGIAGGRLDYCWGDWDEAVLPQIP